MSKAVGGIIEGFGIQGRESDVHFLALFKLNNIISNFSCNSGKIIAENPLSLHSWNPFDHEFLKYCFWVWRKPRFKASCFLFLTGYRVIRIRISAFKKAQLVC